MPPAANHSARQNKEKLNLSRRAVGLERGLIVERDIRREEYWSIHLCNTNIAHALW